MNINWQVRFRHPAFWIGLIGAIGAPILAYMGMGAADLTSWDRIGEMVTSAMGNPYLLGIVFLSVMSFLGIAVDPTTKGIADSARALGYDEPHDDTVGLQ